MLSDDVVCETVKICEINVYNNVNITIFIQKTLFILINILTLSLLSASILRKNK